jgi:hypothetical protein
LQAKHGFFGAAGRVMADRAGFVSRQAAQVELRVTHQILKTLRWH